MGRKDIRKHSSISSSLTPKQQKVLAFIQSHSLRHGYAPSQQEIAKHFGFQSLGTVQNYLVRLQRHGFLKKTWNAKRSLQVAAPPPQQQQAPAAKLLPLVGRVAAGRPLEAIENHELIEVPPSLVRGDHEHFVLQVNGDSMKDDGILHGDFVVIQKTHQARNGQTVVALIDNEATLKKFYRTTPTNSRDTIELHPANADYAPILVSADRDFKIAGILVGVIRRIFHLTPG